MEVIIKMFCENCGQQIEDGSVFCGNCGATIKNENIPAAAVYDTNGYSGPSVSPKKINLVAVLTAALFIPIAVIIYCLSTGALSVYKTDPIKNNAGANEETVSTAESRSEAESIKRAWPDMFENAYCEFTATKGMNVYCDAECTTRGTAVPPLEYNAYIGKGDVCRIFSIGYSGVYVEYPTTSNGYRKGYVHYYGVSVHNLQAQVYFKRQCPGIRRYQRNSSRKVT